MAAGRRFYFSIDVDYHPGSESGLSYLYDFCRDNALKATSFVTGMFAVTQPALVREGVARGYALGTHGWEHLMKEDESFKTGSRDEQRDWLKRSTDAVEKAAGQRPLCFRAPNLAVCETTLGLLEELGYRVDSSVPARRFDMGRGQVNSTRYFFAPLTAYHPSRAHLGRRGDSPVLEVPPSASVVPINLAALRILGFEVLAAATRAVSLQSPLLVFYCHPSEVADPDKLQLTAGMTGNFRTKMGPENLVLLKRYVDFVKRLGYISADFAEYL
ncbi:MAG TPA: polysaccharide deacetylase family protein [Rhizomicrobium sp.]|nr:polysaccharide deacetylase family protein [Rhizomicrobium sp.]